MVGDDDAQWPSAQSKPSIKKKKKKQWDHDQQHFA
jgi:hypothetical protein